MDKLYEIRIHSRGGQGAKTLGQVLAEATIEDGNFTKAFSEYGPERSGAPMQVFAKISSEPVRDHSNVKNPDMVIVIDPTLLLTIDPFQGIKDGGIVIINVSREKLASYCLSFKNCRLYIIDATKIALETLGKDIPNAAILGALSKITDIISRASLEEEVEEHFMRKKDSELAKRNLEAFRLGYEAIEEVKEREIRPAAEACPKPALPSWKDLTKGGVITEPGNAAKFKTGGWKSQKPVRDIAKCTNCMRCFLFCPDSAVKVKLLNDLSEEEKSKIKVKTETVIDHTDYDICKGCGICAKECPEDAIKMEKA